MEGINIGLLIQTTGKWERRKADMTWVTPKEEVVQEASGNQSEMTYIGRRKGAVAQWVAMWTIFEVYARDMVYEGVGRRKDTWW